ncbi:MAG: acyl transferase, partial [Verrucomicrobiae bacterium]|nr:acyl transferase [Verrucomicrobiae bacterium]
MRERIARFIAAGDGDFEPLALELFREQARDNPVYSPFLARIEVVPESVSRWDQIPPLPIGAFKLASVCVFDSAKSVATFHSSGTGGERLSSHFFRDLSLYESSIL